ncbi:MAG: hypothetical protein Q9191_004355 [Dirinaria sp. TL-2023a]
MFRLLDLPNEVIANVIRHAFYKDLWNLVLTCKLIYKLSDAHLKHDQWLNARYCRATNSAIDSGVLVKVLTDVLEDSRKGLYVAHLVIAGWVTSWSDRRITAGMPVESRRYSKTISTSLKQAALTEGYLPPPMRSHWFRKFAAGDEAAVIVLLLLYLPNLKEIIIDTRSVQGGVNDQTLLHLALDHIRNRSDRGFLSKLALVEVTCHEWQSFDTFIRFAQIPSVRRIRGSGLGADRKSARNSIQYLQLVRHDWDVDHDFEFVSEPEEDSSDDESSLTDSETRSRFPFGVPPRNQGFNFTYDYGDYFIDSLRNLKVLKTLVIDLPLLLDGDPIDRDTLGSLLPGSVQSIMLFVYNYHQKRPFSTAALTQILDLLLEEKLKRLRRFHLLSVVGLKLSVAHDLWESEIVEEFDEAGIVLDLIPRGTMEALEIDRALNTNGYYDEPPWTLRDAIEHGRFSFA